MDNLPVTPISDVDWTLLNLWRVFAVTLVCLVVLQMALMLSHYWHYLMPLRKEISTDVRIVAPPVGWTFAYHVVWTLLLTLIGISISQSLLLANRPTIFIFAAPVLFVALSVIVANFQKYYTRSLREGYRHAALDEDLRPVRGPDPTSEEVKDDLRT
jgi:hypothetical protein